MGLRGILLGQESTLEPGEFHKPTGRFEPSKKFRGARCKAAEYSQARIGELFDRCFKPTPLQLQEYQAKTGCSSSARKAWDTTRPDDKLHAAHVLH